MILAVHAIFSAYGFWLPNDPRGSWSTFVASWELYKYGPATTVSTHRSLAYRPHNKQLRQKAKDDLNYPPVLFTGIQARAIGRASRKQSRTADSSSMPAPSCPIMFTSSSPAMPATPETTSPI